MHTRAAGGQPLALVVLDDIEADIGTRPGRVAGSDCVVDVVVSTRLSRRARDAAVALGPSRTHWNEASIRAALTSFVAGHDVWPTYDAFVTAGHKRLRDAIGRDRGAKWWATQLGRISTGRPTRLGSSE
jgi:hypothetical protein